MHFRDITDRRQLEQERQQIAALADASSNFIGVAGLDQRPIYLNRAGEEMVDPEPDKVCSINMLDCFPESDCGRVIDLINNFEGDDHVFVDTSF